MKRALSFAVAVCVLGIGFGSPAATAQPPASHGPYRIAAGDVLNILVWRSAELSMPITVRPDGWISYPWINELQVVGLTPAELRQKIEQALVRTVPDPMVTVVVAKASVFKVSILGKVKQSGRYEVDAGTTVLDVLAEAGGPNDYSDAAGMYVLRRTADGQYERLSARFSSSVTPGKENTNVLLKPGDVIIVP